MVDFSGKVALVTGGGSGIGEATAIEFANNGAKVAVLDVDVESGERVVADLIDLGAEAFYVHADVSSALEVSNAIEEIIERFTRLDLAFNNAGIARLGNVEEFEESDRETVINVNLKGVWLCMKYEVPRMVDAGGGAIVNMASIAGLLGFPYLMAYTASKHGVIGLTKAAALHCAPKGIRVNAVCPTFTKTAMYQPDPDAEAEIALKHPFGRIGTPQDIAGVVVIHLCSESTSFVTGQAQVIDGGYTIQ